jgi:hypothetical protein
MGVLHEDYIDQKTVDLARSSQAISVGAVGPECSEWLVLVACARARATTTFRAVVAP